jgi:Flp pilus assembly protein TadD/hemolysin-activating ACP:hemolysin acyltransferase
VVADEPNHSEVRVSPGGDENPAVALREKGLQRLKAGAFAEAIELLGRAEALDPKDPRTKLGLGVAMQRAGLHSDALEPLEWVQKRLPKEPLAFVHASLSLFALGKAEAALKAASEACLRAPRLPQAHLAHARALMALNQPARAEQACALALQFAPKWPDAWVLCGIARRRQGAIEAAKSAMGEALRLAPGHAAARANLAALLRIGSTAPESRAAGLEIGPDFAHDQRAAGDETSLTAWRPNSPAASLGLAVEYLSKKPAFAKLLFGEWSQTLFYQVARGHYFFVIDRNRRIRGFLGWALTDQRRAELWLEGRSGLSNSDCLEGDSVIINAWSADATGVNAFIREAMHKLFAHRRALYFKRHYPDGRERPVRLTIPAHKIGA